MLRLVFIGASAFGLKTLQAVCALPEVDVVGIVTNPPVFSISYRPEGVTNVLHADVTPFAREHKIPVFEMTGKMTDLALLEQVRDWKPDFIMVAGWYHMIPKTIRDLAPTAGLHASLLPDYSGGAPLVWAMINGEKRTGISFFLMEAGVDSGPLIGQKVVDITPEDTIATLYGRIEAAGLDLIRENLPKIDAGTATYTVQDESKRRLVPQRCPEDGLMNWNQSAQRVFDFVRAQTRPYPGAFIQLDTPAGVPEKLSLWSVSIENIPPKGLAPGEIYLNEEATTVIVGCGVGEAVQLCQASYRGQDFEGKALFGLFQIVEVIQMTKNSHGDFRFQNNIEAGAIPAGVSQA